MPDNHVRHSADRHTYQGSAEPPEGQGASSITASPRCGHSFRSWPETRGPRSYFDLPWAWLRSLERGFSNQALHGPTATPSHGVDHGRRKARQRVWPTVTDAAPTVAEWNGYTNRRYGLYQHTNRHPILDADKLQYTPSSSPTLFRTVGAAMDSVSTDTKQLSAKARKCNDRGLYLS